MVTRTISIFRRLEESSPGREENAQRPNEEYKL
jgi:hypothetical protein